MRVLLAIAFKHLLARRRQSLVSLSGIVLGVAFFLAISSLMQGSERDFIGRLVDNSPHITMVDEFRSPRVQPVESGGGAVEVRNVKPVAETRGIRGFERILDSLRAERGVVASPTLVGQGVISFAGRDVAVTLNGMIASEIGQVTTIERYMLVGSIGELVANPEGIIIGEQLAERLSLALHNNVTIVSPVGEVHTFTVVGIFRVGRSDFDQRQTFITLKRAQALLNRPRRANNILIKLTDPYRARTVAALLESQSAYKCISWQEASEDLLNTLTIRNAIMYTVVSAVLVVAAFGIYNVISTVVIEKQRDIAILKSIGFHARDVQRIFLIEGTVLGTVGSLLGLPLGSAIMYGLMQIEFKPPGVSQKISMPIDWGWGQFAIAAAFALVAAMAAALLPARRAAAIEPVAILRGSQ